MKIYQHIILSLLLFLAYVLLVQVFYLEMFKDSCEEAGGVYQAAYGLCSGLVNQEPDFGAHMSYLRWLFILGMPAILAIATQVSVHAIVVAITQRRRRLKDRLRRRKYRTPN